MSETLWLYRPDGDLGVEGELKEVLSGKIFKALPDTEAGSYDPRKDDKYAYKVLYWTGLADDEEPTPVASELTKAEAYQVLSLMAQKVGAIDVWEEVLKATEDSCGCGHGCNLD